MGDACAGATDRRLTRTALSLCPLSLRFPLFLPVSSSLNRHKRTVHEQKRPWECPECDARFAETSDLGTFRYAPAGVSHRDIRALSLCGRRHWLLSGDSRATSAAPTAVSGTGALVLTIEILVRTGLHGLR